MYLLWLFILSGCLLIWAGFDLAVRPSSTAAAPALFQWTEGPPAPLARFEAQGGAANGKLYVLGGFYDSNLDATTRADVYDPATNTWTQIADMPEAVTHAGQAVDGNTIYIVGGYAGANPGPSTDRVWKYAIDTNTWTAGPSLPAPRGAGAAVRVGRNLHFIAGATRTAGNKNDTTDHPDHYVLNLDGGTTWTTAAPLPNPRNHLGATVLNGKIYAIGGQLGHEEGTANQNQVDVYDPATDTWTRAADLPLARGHITASTFVMHGRIYVVGGSINNGTSGGLLAEVTMYDPQTNVWIKLPSLPMGRKTPVADAIGDRIIVSTGNQGLPSATTWIGALKPHWEQAEEMPVALSTVAGGIIGRNLYLVGGNDPATLSYDLSTGQWGNAAALPPRPFPGAEHTTEVVNGKLYLFGGQGGSAGKVQIFDPVANNWSLGADMPFAAGSSSSALINGEVYIAGGIAGNATTAQAAKYNPATNTWTLLTSMPQGRDHAAAATNGTRLYIFGGRTTGIGAGNEGANGFDTVQVYDPATNTWTSSLDASAGLAPLPQARSGMGKAIYVGGEFYVLGGETVSGTGATAANVYDRVDIYNPVTNRWRWGTTMPTARHGIFPLLIADRIYVAGGGTQAGTSATPLLEVYSIVPQVDPISLTPTPTVTTTTDPNSTQAPSPTGSVPAAGRTIYLPIVLQNGVPGSGESPQPTTTASAFATAVPTDTGTGQATPTTTGVPGETTTPVATTSVPGETAIPTPTESVPGVTATPTATVEQPSATATASPTATRTPITTSNFTEIAWTTVAPYPMRISEGQSAVVNGKLYSFGGYNASCPCYTPIRNAYVYDPVANTWTPLAAMELGLTHAGITSDEKNIYFVAGYIEGAQGGQAFGSKRGWRYNVNSNTYTELPLLPTERAAGSLVYLDGKLHYFGGTNKERTRDVGDHYVLDLNGGTQWTTAAPLPTPRHHMGGVVLNGYIYAVGGQQGHDNKLIPQDSVHRYDPKTNTWTEVAKLPKERNHISSSTIVMDGRIIVLGGQVNHDTPEEILPNVTAYDPQTNTWTELTPLPRRSFSSVAGVINGEIFLSTAYTGTTYKGVPILTPSSSARTSPRLGAWTRVWETENAGFMRAFRTHEEDVGSVGDDYRVANNPWVCSVVEPKTSI